MAKSKKVLGWGRVTLTGSIDNILTDRELVGGSRTAYKLVKVRCEASKYFARRLPVRVEVRIVKPKKRTQGKGERRD